MRLTQQSHCLNGPKGFIKGSQSRDKHEVMIIANQNEIDKC